MSLSNEDIKNKYGLDNYFYFSNDIKRNAYLNWRFELNRDIEDQFFEIGKAYFETAIFLLEDCLKDNICNKADAWIFPILFNIVHGIEIYLKGFNSIFRIYMGENDKTKIEGNHDIKQLCQISMSLLKGKKNAGVLEEFEIVYKFIEYLYENTNDMSFARYPIKKDKKQQFYVTEGENVVIHLPYLLQWISVIFKILDKNATWIVCELEDMKQY